MAKVSTRDGRALYAEAQGEGPACVFSCAYCTTHENWRGQVAPLVRAGQRAVLWDLRGHGLSDAPDDPDAYSMDAVVDDLARVVDWASPDAPVVLAGLSFGGLASLHFALRAPERVRALVLCGSGPGFKKPEAQQRWQEQTERTAQYLEKRGLEAFVHGKAGATCVGRKPDLPAARAAGEAIARQSVAGLAHFGRRVTGFAPSVIDDLQRIEQPALVLVGEHDEAFLRASEVMAAKLPNAVRQVIPDAGHILNIEAAPAFDDALVDFLEQLPAAGRILGPTG